MEESSPTLTRSMIGSEETKASMNFVAPGRMEVRVTGNSLVMDFDSDTDEEEGLADTRQFPAKSADLSGPLLLPPGSGPTTTVCGSGNARGLFQDADDDFCIVDTPTFTRVVRADYKVIFMYIKFSSGSLLLFYELLIYDSCVYIVLQSPGSKPVVKCLLEDEEHIEVVQNHFSIPVSIRQ